MPARISSPQSKQQQWYSEQPLALPIEASLWLQRMAGTPCRGAKKGPSYLDVLQISHDEGDQVGAHQRRPGVLDNLLVFSRILLILDILQRKNKISNREHLKKVNFTFLLVIFFLLLYTFFLGKIPNKWEKNHCLKRRYEKFKQGIFCREIIGQNSESHRNFQ